MEKSDGTGAQICEAGVALYESSAKSKKFAGAVGIMGVLWAGAGAMTLLAGAAPIVEIALAAAAGVNLAGASLGYVWSSRARMRGTRMLESAVVRVGSSAVVSSLRSMGKNEVAVRAAIDQVRELPRVEAYESMEVMENPTPARAAAAAEESRARAALLAAKEAEQEAKSVEVTGQKVLLDAPQRQADQEGRSESFEAQALALRDKKAATHAAQEAGRPASPALVDVAEAKAPKRGRLRG